MHAHKCQDCKRCQQNNPFLNNRVVINIISTFIKLTQFCILINDLKVVLKKCWYNIYKSFVFIIIIKINAIKIQNSKMIKACYYDAEINWDVWIMRYFLLKTSL